MMNQDFPSQPSITSLAEKYQVNKDKPFFPLNSLRLVYLIFAETISVTNDTVRDRRGQDILALIPKVQALLDARTTHRAEKPDATLETEWQAVQPAIIDILAIVDSPKVRMLFEHVFSYIFPLQDTLLISLYNDLSNNKPFAIQDIYSIFHIRSMDSIVYSGLVAAVLEKDVSPEMLPVDLQLSLNYKLSALYQLNDLVDAIVYAKEDLEHKNFSPFELIRKAAKNVDEAKEMIKGIASTFEKRIHAFPLGEQTEILLTEFSHELVNVISRGQ
ncbi:MAG: hypothetical protein ABI425_00370 [Patescibacteria group bacterium]